MEESDTADGHWEGCVLVQWVEWHYERDAGELVRGAERGGVRAGLQAKSLDNVIWTGISFLRNTIFIINYNDNTLFIIYYN